MLRTPGFEGKSGELVRRSVRNKTQVRHRRNQGRASRGLLDPGTHLQTRISCTLPYPTTACAAFIKESRMECANATKLHKKFGEPRAALRICGQKTVFYVVRPALKILLPKG